MNGPAPETNPAPVATPAVAPVAPKSFTRVHKIDSVSDQMFWSGHVVFSVLALVGVALILLARGPRRKEANANALLENRESGTLSSGSHTP
ncbi:MAG: hypothetical protein RIR26_2606 [Pseudomonadota bacterium]|jgi:hypothetical protein